MAQDKEQTWVLSEHPAAKGLVDVFFLDTKRGWAVGTEGVILSSHDGGLKWTKVREDSKNEDLRSIAFGDENVGIAVGGGGYACDRGILPKCLRTIDGGKTWSERQVDPSWSEEGVQLVQWLSPMRVLLIGASIYRSDDAGETWKPLGRGPKAASHIGRFTSESAGWFVRLHKLIKTTDGGASFEQQTGLEELLDGKKEAGIGFLFALDSDNVWAFGLSTKWVFRTNDGGKTWNLVGRLPSVHDVRFVDRNVGWSVTMDWDRRESVFRKTTDGGATWVEKQKVPHRVRQLHFQSARQGWAAGDDVILRLE
jgi:photosystem II stability/assembly factor-like uncharacterized protein